MPSALLLLCILPVVLSYTSGPPVSSNANLCTDMIPDGHNGGVSQAADQGNPPYTITTSASEYSTGGTLTVTISGTGGNQFEGFFIQARRADPALDNDVAIGTFTAAPANSQLLECHNVANSAWGHSNADARTTIAATWNAPAQDEGPIEFRATIVKGDPNRNYFYLDVKSAEVSFMATEPVVNDGATQASTTSAGHTHALSLALLSLAGVLTAIFAVHQDSV